MKAESTELRTIVIPEAGLPYVKESGNLLYDYEVEDLCDQGRLVNADGSAMTRDQLDQRLHPNGY